MTAAWGAFLRAFATLLQLGGAVVLVWKPLRERASERENRAQPGDAFVVEVDDAQVGRRAGAYRFVTEERPDVYAGVGLIVIGVTQKP